MNLEAVGVTQPEKHGAFQAARTRRLSRGTQGVVMYGRYGRWSRRQRIEELLGIAPSGLDDFPTLYNITPGVNTWIARAKDGHPALYSYLWGLVPYWSKDPKKGARSTRERRRRTRSRCSASSFANDVA